MKDIRKESVNSAMTTEKSKALRLQRYSKHQFDQSDMTQESCMIEQHKSELR
jgi:hypothetical protein